MSDRDHHSLGRDCRVAAEEPAVSEPGNLAAGSTATLRRIHFLGWSGWLRSRVPSEEISGDQKYSGDKEGAGGESPVALGIIFRRKNRYAKAVGIHSKASMLLSAGSRQIPDECAWV